MSFGIALSGINAAQNDLSVTSNNIANAQTNGFKQSRSEFAALFAVSPQGVGRAQTGNGVKIGAVVQQFTQGNIESTNNSLDMAISGQGFFTLSDNGALVYSRAGSFSTDAQGYVVNTEGQRLQVYQPSTGGAFNTTALGDLRLVTSDSAPQATAKVDLVFNLAANASQPATAVFDPAVPDSYNNSTSLTVYDSLGAAHTASMYFVKTATANTWDSYVYIDGNSTGPAQTLAYSNAGVLTTPATGSLTVPPYAPSTGAAPMNMAFNLGQTTQYGANFGVSAVSQDGYTTGRLIGINVDTTGVVQARFTNGRSIAMGQIAIANFANPQGLQQLAGTSWAETFGSGQALRGQAGSSSFGLIQSGSLESSNVDITQQLVNMITAQRNFQANAQMISTQDQIMQSIIQIR